MKHSKRATEGYVMLDHRGFQGLTDEQTHNSGLPPGAGRGLYESSFVSCSHCQAVVVMNPQRTRARGYCSKCDRYLCDRCEGVRATTLECKPAFQQIDEIIEAAVRATMISEV